MRGYRQLCYRHYQLLSFLLWILYVAPTLTTRSQFAYLCVSSSIMLRIALKILQMMSTSALLFSALNAARYLQSLEMSECPRGIITEGNTYRP